METSFPKVNEAFFGRHVAVGFGFRVMPSIKFPWWAELSQLLIHIQASWAQHFLLGRSIVGQFGRVKERETQQDNFAQDVRPAKTCE